MEFIFYCWCFFWSNLDFYYLMERLYISCTLAFTYMQILYLYLAVSHEALGLILFRKKVFDPRLVFRVNVAGLVVIGRQLQITSLQSHCLSSTSTPITTNEHHIEKHLDPFGKVINVRIRRNFSFIQHATQEDARKSLEATQKQHRRLLLFFPNI